jgi:hypothetical protein
MQNNCGHLPAAVNQNFKQEEHSKYSAKRAIVYPKKATSYRRKMGKYQRVAIL